MSGRGRLLALLDDAEAALQAGRTQTARRKLHDLRALVVFLVPAVPEICPECEVGGGHHVEGCAYAGGESL